MENTFKGFGEESFENEFQGFGFDGGEEAVAETVAPATAPRGARAKLGDIPLSQINGLQNGKFADLEAAQDAIMAMDPAEVQRRKENGENFVWVKTIIDKEEWVTKEDGKRVLKSPKFLGWLVITNDSNGMPQAMADATLLAYITNNCPQTGKIGSGETGLQLRHAVRKNKSAKGGNFTNTIVISLVPMEKSISKYAPSKIETAKYPVFEEDGVTPVRVLRPGAPSDSEIATDYIQKYEWKPEYEEIFKRKPNRTKKKDQASEEAFKILAFMQGLKPQY